MTADRSVVISAQPGIFLIRFAPAKTWEREPVVAWVVEYEDRDTHDDRDGLLVHGARPVTIFGHNRWDAPHCLEFPGRIWIFPDDFRTFDEWDETEAFGRDAAKKSLRKAQAQNRRDEKREKATTL